jgi:hypothetical protein
MWTSVNLVVIAGKPELARQMPLAVVANLQSDS